MAPPNILNLDDYRVTRSVIINGKERVVRNMTVEQFIAAADIEKRLAATSSEREQIPILVEVVAQYVEGVERGEVMNLDIAQLLVLLAFVRGADVAPNTASGNAGQQDALSGEADAGGQTVKSGL